MARYNKLQVVRFNSRFEVATHILEPPKREPEANEALLKVHYVGINATDVNVVAGGFHKFMKVDKDVPFDIGFEALVEIEQIGDDMKPIMKSIGLKEGSPALYIGEAAYAEYIYVDTEHVKVQLFSIPALEPEYLAFGISGMTASMALDTAVKIKEGDKIIVAPAAGDVGHLTVQWALIHGAHVIGIASTIEEVNLLKSLGCHRVINYKEEDMDKVLTDEYPEGVDIVWETTEGDTRKILFEHLALNGQIMSVGAISSYMFPKKSDAPVTDHDSMVLKKKDIKMRTFAVFSRSAHYGEYIEKQIEQFKAGKYKPILDFGEKAADGPFRGLEAVRKGVNWLHSGENIGKVLVKVV